MQSFLRFLDLVRRELGADDVRAEIGGRDPTGEDAIWSAMPSGMRLVAIFDQPPEDPPAKRERLSSLAESFASLGAIDEISHVAAPRSSAIQDLDDALALLAQRARATASAVVDDASPEIWGASIPLGGGEDVDDARWISKVSETAKSAGGNLAELVRHDRKTLRSHLVDQGLSPPEVAALAREIERMWDRGSRVLDHTHILTMRALAAVRAEDAAATSSSAAHASSSVKIVASDLHLLVRPFATIYRLVLVYEAPFSELHAEAAVIHALPLIERLVTSLPPRDPATRGGKVAVLRRLRPA